jgi:hypothetical protein
LRAAAKAAISAALSGLAATAWAGGAAAGGGALPCTGDAEDGAVEGGGLGFSTSPGRRRAPVVGPAGWASAGAAASRAANKMRGDFLCFTPGIVGRELRHHNGKLLTLQRQTLRPRVNC